MNLSSTCQGPIQRWLWLCLIFIFGGTGVAWAAPSSRPVPRLSASSVKAASDRLEAPVERLLASLQFAKAVALLQEQLKHKVTAKRLLALGRAFALLGKHPEAVKASMQLVEQFPRSQYRVKALMQAADALAALRQFERSQALYAKRISALLSTKRRLAIAEVYLKFARRYAQAKPGKPAQLSKSIRFYDKVLSLELPEPHRRGVVLALARVYSKSSESWWTIKRFLQKSSKKYAKGTDADELSFLLAKTYMKRHWYRQARRLLQDLQEDFPKSRWLPGSFLLMAQTYRLPGVTSAPELTSGIQVLQQMLKRYPKHAKSRKAAFWITTAYYRNGRYDKAIQHAKQFIAMVSAETPTTQKSSSSNGEEQETQRRYEAQARYRIAQCYMAQRHYRRAIEAFQDFLKSHPTDRDWPKAQHQIISARYLLARAYLTQKKWAQAKQAFEKFLQQYPIDSRNALIMWELGQMERKQKRPKEAIAAWERLVSKYPHHRKGRQARWDIAQTYEQKLFDYTRALATYRSIKYWRFRARARSAIRRLAGKSLSVLTPKVFSTKDAPYIEASARNIKSLHVRMYLIDPETYFRKMLRFDGMDKLDIELIRPDKSWDVPVKGFRKHHLHKVKISLPANRPMVAVFRVSGGKFAATTVAIVSDLQIISKVGRHSLFVYALNTTKQKPLADVRLLISDGKKIIHVGKTNAQGFLQKRFPALRKTNQIRVLALSGSSVAASDNSLAGISYSEGVSIAGVVYTDRPAYRPGEMVMIRSIVREVKDGQYQLPTASYQIDVSGPDGRVLFQRKQKPGAFGTVHTAFPTDPASPPGWYQAKVSRKGGGTFVARFQLADYSLPKFHISIKPKHLVWQRHQRIAGTVQLRYGFGAPAANRLVLVKLASLQHKARTDAKGQLTFAFSTRELNAERRYTITARLLGESASTQAQIWLRSTMFDLGISTIRSIYAAGESIEVKVKAADPAGQPHAAKVTLRWVRLSKVWGRQIETEAGRQSLDIDAKGAGTATIQIKKGGSYRLLATTQDARKQAISARHHIFVAGEEDKQPLRLLSDKEHAQVGDTLQVKLLARKQGLALLTYEADEVLYHRLIPVLAKGETMIPIKITAKMSPNFALRIALLHKQKLYTAEKHFLVSKQLKLQVTVKETSIAPGGWATLRITAKDQRGKGVKAEVSVAVVDKSIYALYKEHTPKLADIFYAYRRKLQQSAQASHTYKHTADGSRISDELLRLQTQPTGSTAFLPQMKQQAQTRNGRRWHWRGRRKFRRFYNFQDQQIQGQLNRPQGQFSLGNANGFFAHRSLSNSSGLVGGELHRRMFAKGLRQRFATTAYWNPSVQTDQQGNAEIRVRMPDNAATWKIWMRGVALPTLVGEASGEYKTKKPFLVALRLPGVLTDGDQIQPSAIVHNRTAQTLKADVVIAIKGLGMSERKQLVLPPHSSQTLLFSTLPTKGAGGRIVQVKLAASATVVGQPKAAAHTDAIARPLQIRTPGIEIFASSAGVAKDSTTATLTLPGEGPFQRKMLQVSLGPVSAQWLVDLAQQGAGGRHFFPGMLVYRASITERVLRYLKRVGQGNSPDAKRLRGELESMTRSLWSQQLKDGGWGFIGKRRYSDRERLFSALVFSVQARAHYLHGLYAPTGGLKRARRYVKQGYQSTFSAQAKATILAALSLMAAQDQHELFSYANRLYRNRTRLSLEALAQLGFALVALQRPHLAKELVPYIEAQLKTGTSKKPRSKRLVVLPYSASAALALELLAQIAPLSTVREAGIAALLQHRKGQRWGGLVLSHRVIGALASHYGTAKASQVKLKVSLQLDGKVQKVIHLTAHTPTFVWRHDLSASAASHKITLQADGLGRFQYAIRLRGFSPKPDASMRSRYVHIKRSYTPAYRQIGGITFAPGFHAVRGTYKRWKRIVKSLPIGDHARVAVKIWRPSKGKIEDLIVDEPIPGGAFVLPSSISVNHGRFQIERGRIRFFLHHSTSRWSIRYHLYGTRPGQFQIPATRVWSFAQPGRLSLGLAHKLEILPADTKRRPHYRKTPDELLDMGAAHYKAGRKAAAKALLERLVNDYKLKAHASRKAAKMLLQIAFEQGPQESIVRYFELRKEQDPDAILSFDKIVKVGHAYATQREFERAAQVYQATLQAHFLNVLQVAGALEQEGEFTAARTFIEGLLWQYPDTKSLKEAAYGLAQTAYQQAAKERAKPTKFAAWMGHAERLLRLFVRLYPTHPSADTAAYTRANVLLELKRKQDAIDYLARLAKRYPKSNELDSIHYLHAYALYLQLNSKEALALLHKVSTQEYPTSGDTGPQPSKHKYLATYLIAQLHHANSHLATALEWYKKVQKRFADAAAQVQHFQQVQLILPEVTTIGAKAKAVLKIKHQNIKQLTILAYRVDLMKLYVHKKNLNAVTRINLAGIRPTYQSTHTLGKGNEFNQRTTSLSLPLPKRGAYLIVLKSAEREVSGILLRTRLMLEVQQDINSGRVTAYLLQRTSRMPSANAVTRAVGSAVSHMYSGKTDLRGIYSVENIKGYATVIAQAGDDFAFFRGKVDLQHSLGGHTLQNLKQMREQMNKRVPSPAAAPRMLEHINRDNEYNFNSGRRQMLDLYQQSKKGVQMKYFK